MMNIFEASAKLNVSIQAIKILYRMARLPVTAIEGARSGRIRWRK